MSRRGQAPKRVIKSDPIYGSELISRVINCFMLDGKKQVAEKALYVALEKVEKKSGRPAMDVFNEAIANISPVVEVRSRRLGGATYQVPMEVRPDRVRSLAIKWLVRYARDRKEKNIEDKIAHEILDAAKGEGKAVAKKQEVHAVAESNKAFAHYRW